MNRRRITALVMFHAVVLMLAVGGGVANAGSQVGEPRFNARMSGDQEVPVADPDGAGGARFELKLGRGQLCFKMQFHKTGTPNRGHIHVGAAGENGAIVVPLFELVGDPTNPWNDRLENRHLEGCVAADEAILNEIAANPEGFYCNLHNARFPAGAIRGQLT
ncbi:MAG: CHRD domain-containing protein [Acidimicrobiales bacterium]